MSDDKRLSKSLSYWLRHRPDAGGLILDESGWAPVAQVLAALARAGQSDRREDLERVVRESDKNRFELSPNGESIRARQGHSVEVDLDWPIVEPPETLYHGTAERFLDAIMAEGLKPMNRHHVHLSPDVETARRVGARRGRPVILSIAAGRMARDGFVFRLSGNGVWLSDLVAPLYLERFGD